MIFDFFKNSDNDKDAYKSIAKNAKEYGELYLQLFKLNAVGALSRFVSYLIVVIVGVMLLVTVLIFLSAILILWLKNATGSLIYSLLIMSGIFVLLFLILLLLRKKLMLNPIIKKMSSILFSKESELLNDENFEDITKRDIIQNTDKEPITEPLFQKEDTHD
ncbi:MAG: phage holin family protein [Bacteroidales bacterium]|nr:phage holin family protein [Bacteroidales bacterium]